MISHAVAPCSPILFKWVYFKLFGMQINQYNAIGIFMAIVTVIYQIFVYFYLTNLTKEPGYQIFLKLEGKEDSGSGGNPNKKSLSILKILNSDMIVVFIGVFLIGFLFSQADIYINILTITKFHWRIEFLGLVATVCITITAVLMKLIGTMNSEVDIIFIFTIMQTTFCIMMNLMCIPISFDIQNRSLQVGLVGSVFVLSMFAGYKNQFLSNCILFMTAPMSSRCVIVGVQIVTLKTALGLGYLSASTFYGLGSIVYPAFAILVLISAIIHLMRSQNFLQKYVQNKVEHIG